MTAVLFHVFLRALQEQCQPREATDHESPGSSCSITELKLPQSALITLRKVHCRVFMTSLKADEDLPAVTDMEADSERSSLGFSWKARSQVPSRASMSCLLSKQCLGNVKILRAEQSKFYRP